MKEQLSGNYGNEVDDKATLAINYDVLYEHRFKRKRKEKKKERKEKKRKKTLSFQKWW